MFDPTLLLIPGTMAGGVGLKMLEKKLDKKRSVEISYYASDGNLEIRKVRSNDTHDEFGFRIGYSAHYARTLEIEIYGNGRTPCGCETCEHLEYLEQKRIQAQKEEIERAALEAKRAEEAKKMRERREKTRIALTKEMRDGKLDEYSPKSLIAKGIRERDIEDYMDGAIVHPHISMMGSTSISYEAEEVSREEVNEEIMVSERLQPVSNVIYEKIDYNFFKVTRTTFPTGEVREVRQQINESEYPHDIKRIVAKVSRNRPVTPIYKPNVKELREILAQNKKNNDAYLEDLRRMRREVKTLKESLKW